MINDHIVQREPGADELLLEDLLPAMAVCGAEDPGRDPTWDYDPYPPDRIDGQAHT